MIRVHVPATSANLGPGYDCLGLALDWEGVFDFERIESGVSIHGCNEQYCNEDNLVYRSFLHTLAAMNEEISGISITIHCDIPTQRGLGSSAACIVAGAMGANALFQNRLNKYELFSLCTRMEGHPDNVAPALFGQLTVSFIDEGQPSMIRYGLHPQLKFLAMIPQTGVSTQEARSLLPDHLSYADAVSQIGRSVALCKALEIGNHLIIRKACHDTMHEPYRRQLIEEYDQMYEIAKKAGASAMFISGSGSTMLAVSDEESILMDIMLAGKKAFPIMEMKILKADRIGAWSEVL